MFDQVTTITTSQPDVEWVERPYALERRPSYEDSSLIRTESLDANLSEVPNVNVYNQP